MTDPGSIPWFEPAGLILAGLIFLIVGFRFLHWILFPDERGGYHE